MNLVEPIEVPATELGGHKVKTSFYTFKPWEGKPVIDTYGGKAILCYSYKPMFAELVELHIYMGEGYEGVWVDTFKKKFRIGLPGIYEPVLLPSTIDQILKEIIKINGTSSGVWDLLLWKDGRLKFVELKRQKKDKIRATQVKFLESCLTYGLKVEQFEILEWKWNKVIKHSIKKISNEDCAMNLEPNTPIG